MIGLGLAAGAQEEAPSEAGGAAATEPILSAMGELESARDAKCHSTACRFENFVFGTPLTDEGRDAKVELQKELVRRVWRGASERALAADRATVGAELLVPELERIFRRAETEGGDVVVRFGEAEPITLASVRVLQYGSIAYALRAILAVQQDALLDGGGALLPLEEPALDALRAALDTVTLCALQVSDEDARADSRDEIDAPAFRRAWRRLVPASTAVDTAHQEGPGVSNAEAFAVLHGIIREKTEAYRKYNGLTQVQANERLVINTERFYALYEVPPNRQKMVPFLESYNRAMVDFSLRLLVVSDASAKANGHRLIRSEDAVAAIQELTPHEVDDLEDVHFFGRLEPHAQVTLEAYDCDSYRDLGRHWNYMGEALDLGGEAVERVPDPFAAEILAESISQYGVLVLRVAGEIAKERREAGSLEPVDVHRAARRISRRAVKHHELPERVDDAPGIVSVADTGSPRVAGEAFSDVTGPAGIAYQHRSSKWLSEFRREREAGPPTFSGGGVAAEDLDADGDPDLVFVGGLGLALYRNEGFSDGGGSFTDVHAEGGLGYLRPDGTPGEARAAIPADFDDDGRPDLLITYANDPHRLYRNLGGMRFEDRTEAAALGGAERIGGPATVLDFDRDGLLDVYVCYFGNYLVGAIPTIDRDNRNGLPNELFRNTGGLAFENVTAGSGTDDTGWCQAVSHTDFDRDGWQDIVVANDFGRNVLLRNRHDGSFENLAPSLGVTKAYHSMNVGVTDLNADDYPDIYISNIATLVKDNKYVLPDVNTPMDFGYDAMATMLVKESDMLYMSKVGERLEGYEPSTDVERGKTSTGWAWDAEFFDVDLDGDDDLYVVNGTNDYNYYGGVHRFEDEEGEVDHLYLSHARESNVFFENEGGKLRNRSEGSGADLLLNSRSTAYLDYDGDGDLDVALNNFHSPAVLLRNNAEVLGRNWLRIELQGDPERGSNRDAIGARIVVTTRGGIRASREIQGGSGYLSSNPKTQHVGLGSETEADVRIVWPNGEVQELTAVAANRTLTLRQGASSSEGR